MGADMTTRQQDSVEDATAAQSVQQAAAPAKPPPGWSALPSGLLDAMVEVLLAQPAGQVFQILTELRDQSVHGDQPDG